MRAQSRSSRISFQSTHSVRGATAGMLPFKRSGEFQSTHPVRGATEETAVQAYEMQVFQSTHPVRGATAQVMQRAERCMISIHAPRAGCDPSPPPPASHRCDFNPRTPCGVRRAAEATRRSCSALFQSTHPVRGATAQAPRRPRGRIYFNPRTPCGVRRLPLSPTFKTSSNFNPRTPCGVRRPRPSSQRPAGYFNPRTPCGVRP